MSPQSSRKVLGSLRLAAGRNSYSARHFTSASFLSASKETNPREQKQEPNRASSETPLNSKNNPSNPDKVKSVSQADKELRERLEQMSGEGGAAGIEYEDGKPNAMKRGVRNNMFRLI